MTETIPTIELLEADGWVKSKDDTSLFFLMEKKLPNANPINASEDTDISLIVHSDFGQQQFAVLFPDGGKLNFGFDTMEQLQLFEKMLHFYDAPF